MVKRSVVLALLFYCAAASAAEPRTAPGITIKPRGSEPVSIALPDRGSSARVIVEFRSSAGLSRFRADVAKLAASRTAGRFSPHIVREFSTVLDGAAVEIAREQVASLRALPYVRAVYADRKVHALGAVEPGVSAVHAPDVWSGFHVRGEGMVVAIIDTGIDYRHPALGGGIGPAFRIAGGYDFVDNDSDPMDENGHGTHVAGIVAADSSDLLGVAPGASLVAYRVLDKSGEGNDSDVIAGIERAVDPNGDGNTADHVQVINLSLGAEGSPDDPVSRAVNAAVDAGVVVCAAAGNAGRYLAIDSPGTAAKAITVGATSDLEIRVASYSSAGPNPVDYTIKPDVVAPGSSVRSCGRNGTYIWMSGTSMATPHVAGVAALLRQLHPDWSPSTVKEAIVNNARKYAGAVMQSGSGHVDALHSASAKLFVSPVSLSFGITDGSAADFAAKRTLTVRNASDTPRDLTFTITSTTFAVAAAVSPTSVTIPPGESREIEVSISFTNASVPFNTAFSRDGVLEIHDGGDTQRVAWAVVKGLRFRLNDGVDALGALAAGKATPRYDLRKVQDGVFETLVRPGTYDLTVYGFDSRSTTAPFFFAAVESQVVNADRTFTISQADIPYRVAFRGIDHTGTPIAYSQPTRECFGHRTLELPAGGPVDYIRVSGHGMQGVMTSTLSDRYIVTGGEICRTNDLLNVDLLHFASVRGVSADVERTAGGAGLHPQSVSLTYPPFASGASYLVLTGSAYTPVDREDFGFVESWSKPVWNGTVYLEESDDTDNATWAALEAYTTSAAGWAYMQPMPLRMKNGRVTSWNSRTLPPNSHFWSPDETMSFGSGFSMVRPFFWSYGPDRVLLDTGFAGGAQERRYPFVAPVTKVFDSSGKVVAEGGFGMQIDLSVPVRLTIESDQYLLEGVRGRTSYNASLTALAADSVPPIFTALVVLDTNGSAATRLRASSNAKIELAAMDYLTRDDIAHIKEGSLAVYYRRSGSLDWKPLPLTKTGEDYGTNVQLQRNPMGDLFEVDLRPATNAGAGYYDLRVTVEDLSGNTAESTIEPAFVVDGSPRLRPVRR